MDKLFQTYSNLAKHNNQKFSWNIISNIITGTYLALGLFFLFPGHLTGPVFDAIATSTPLLYYSLFLFIPVGNPLIAVILSFIPAKPSIQIRNSLIIFFEGCLIFESQYHFFSFTLSYFRFHYYPYNYFYVFIPFLILLLPAVVGYIRIRKRINNSKS